MADFHDAMVEAKELGMYTAGHIPYAVGLERVLAEGMDEIAHVEELLFEFLDVDRSVSLSSEEWLPYIIEAALLQWDFSSSSFQAEFEIDNLETLASITDRLRSANVPICTTMVVDDVIQEIRKSVPAVRIPRKLPTWRREAPSPIPRHRGFGSLQVCRRPLGSDRTSEGRNPAPCRN
jgi:hypothetical protein